MTERRIEFAPGSIEAALANGTKLLAANPSAALLQARKIIEFARDSAPAHWLLAKALTKTGDPERARLAQAKAVSLSRNVTALAGAMKAIRTGKSGDVPQLLEAHLMLHPDDPVALLLLGEAQASVGLVTEGVGHLEAALAIMPDYGEARMALARANFKRFDPAGARDALRPAVVEHKSRDPGLLQFYAILQAETGDYAGAEATLRELVKTQPHKTQFHMALGDILRTIGRTDEAEAAYRDAISLAPASGRPWWALASIGGNRLNVSDRDRMEQALRQARSSDDRLHLGFAVASVADRDGEYERAFTLYLEANRLRREALHYDGAAFQARIEKLGVAMNQGLLASRADWGISHQVPIFIVGMPRSGSTLVEQILARHSDVRAGGEMPIVTALLRETGARMGLDPDSEILTLLNSLDPKACQQLGAEYLRRAQGRSPGQETFLTDKLPHNWAEIAFIAMILPKARFIDVRRGAMDCCVSNFALLFQPGHPACYDLNEMADYYSTYVRGMQAASAALPGRIHLLQYEALVGNAEREARRLLAFLGIDFEPACLEFHLSRDPVATASSEQVRQPLNRLGIGSWRRFEPWLAPLRERLGALATD